MGKSLAVLKKPSAKPSEAPSMERPASSLAIVAVQNPPEVPSGSECRDRVKAQKFAKVFQDLPDHTKAA
eukprot:10558733-Alexandrium_andersonii.AAC.1